MSSNTDHVDLILLKPPTASERRRGGLPKSCWRGGKGSHLLIELLHALLADVVGSDDGQQIKGRDGKSEEVTQMDKMKQRRETPALASAVVKMAPTKTKTITRLQSVKTRTRQRLQTFIKEKTNKQNIKNITSILFQFRVCF